MVSILATLIFTAAFAVSFWSIYDTVAPRLDYMRALMKGEAMPSLAPIPASRVRPAARSTMVSTAGYCVRAAA